MSPRCSAVRSPLAVLAVIGASTSIASADLPEYHVTDLGPMIEAAFPGVTFPSSDARALNEHGDVAGEASLNGSAMQGWVYTVEHGLTVLPLPPGWPAAAVRDVSERDANGEIVIVGGGVPGVHVDIAIGEAVVWRYSTVSGTVLETRVLPIPVGFDDALAMAVNNDGIVVGFSELTGPFTNWWYDVATDELQTFDFPARVADMNNDGIVCGANYRGDRFGTVEDLSDPYDPGDVMPQWAIDNGGISAAMRRINDHGWTVGRAGTGISDGAGHFLVAIVRFADELGWTGMPPISHLSLAGSLNNHGDFMTRTGGVYFDETGTLHGVNTLLAPEFAPQFSVGWTEEINDHRQIAGAQAHALLLTPLGEMIIPGDINGDVSVDLADHCAWSEMPIDLDGDGDVDADDDQWLRDRLAVFGHTVTDCNANGIGDFCDIADGRSFDCDGNGVPDECQPDCNGDGVPDACEDDCNANGVPDPCDILNETSDDCNGNGIPDECDAGGVTEVSVTHDPPRFMFADDVIVEEVLVTEAGIVDDLDVHLDYRYRIGYTTVQIEHLGTTVTILARPGHPAHLNGFVNFGYDALIDDEGTGPFLEVTGDSCCSFETILSPPIYRPDGALSAFDGMPSEGVWRFMLSTTADFSSGDGLHGWGLTITRAGVNVPPCCPGDLDDSGAIDFADLVTLLASWGDCTGVCAADLDESGAVDFADLLALLSAWGSC